MGGLLIQLRHPPLQAVQDFSHAGENRFSDVRMIIEKEWKHEGLLSLYVLLCPSVHVCLHSEIWEDTVHTELRGNLKSEYLHHTGVLKSLPDHLLYIVPTNARIMVQSEVA